MTFATTSSDLAIDFLEPSPDQISFHDIALGLSKCCRFAGQCQGHYSVAQHSVLVALLLPPELRWEGLLHDATEAYMGDLSTPLKSLLPDYKKVEARVDAAIRIKAGLPAQPNPLVKQADQIALAIEARDLMPSSALNWPNVKEILASARLQDDLMRTVHPIENWQQAYAMFIGAMRTIAPKRMYREIPGVSDFPSFESRLERLQEHAEQPQYTKQPRY